MKSGKVIIFVLVLLVCHETVIFAQNPKPIAPRVFLLDSQILQANERKIFERKESDASLNAAVDKLEKDARRFLKTEIVSVVTKQVMPPSGDKHDYMSQAPYFWRNADTKDGLPYVRRDGERNPEIKKYPDHDLLDKMTEAVATLSEAYYFTKKEEYAARAAEILRMWFLDSKTKMNPNLEFAQAIPGINTGRGIGIIETRRLTEVVDSIGLLSGSESWTREDQQGVESWFSQYLEWLIKSKNGLDEKAAKNNHGTFYDVQVATFALFTGKKDLAKQILETAKQKRIALQIEPDGHQPLELERTKSWDYSNMNLDGLICLAKLGENVGVNLWNFESKDGRGIRKAIEFLAQFLDDQKRWSYQQIEPLKPERVYPAIRCAARKYKDEKFTKMAASLPGSEANDKTVLLGF